ncbi:MAG: formate dehydrogenase accessory protein FdhE [Terriglobales bacterium]
MAQRDQQRAETVRRFGYQQRRARAYDLAAKCPFAAELLAFYARMAEIQSQVSSAAGATLTAGPSDFHTLADSVLERLLSYVPVFEDIVRSHGPAAMADAVKGGIDWPGLLRSFWTDRAASSPEARFFALALLQPYAELVAVGASLPAGQSGNCPVCGSEPVVGVLRPEGYGARRSLICSLCSSEWDFLRATCPSCSETRPEALPVYTSEQFEHVKIEACDTCKQYLKTVDLTKDGLAVPIVDELATVPLNLWAGEKNYTKLCPNLFNL